MLASRIVHWKQTLVIIQPDTLLRWHHEGFHLFWRHRSKSKATKHKITREAIDLIQRVAKENLLWGAERIQGELLKLGIRVAKFAVQRYMRPVRPSQPPRQTWSTFLKTHAEDMRACDFLPVTDLFFRPTFVFFIIELASRLVVHFGVTRHPNETWTAQQLREATPFGVGPKFLIRDSDNKFGILLNRVAKGTGIQVLKIPFRTPPRAQRSGRLHAALSRTHFRQEPLDVWEYFVNPHERPHVVEPRQGDKRYVGYLLGTLLGKRVCLIHFSGVEHARHSY